MGLDTLSKFDWITQKDEHSQGLEYLFALAMQEISVRMNLLAAANYPPAYFASEEIPKLQRSYLQTQFDVGEKLKRYVNIDFSKLDRHVFGSWLHNLLQRSFLLQTHQNLFESK